MPRHLLIATSLLLYCIFTFSFSSAQAKNSLDFKKTEAQTLLIGTSAADYHLILNLPKGWKNILNSQITSGFITQFIPKNQNQNSWKDMISLELNRTKNTSDYAQLHSFLSDAPLNKNTCKDFKQSGFNDIEQNGFKTVEFFVECVSSSYSPGVGEAIVYKYIMAGEKIGMISIWRSWKIKNDKDLLRARSEYLDYITLFRQVDLKKYIPED